MVGQNRGLLLDSGCLRLSGGGIFHEAAHIHILFIPPLGSSEVGRVGILADVGSDITVRDSVEALWHRRQPCASGVTNTDYTRHWKKESRLGRESGNCCSTPSHCCQNFGPCCLIF